MNLCNAPDPNVAVITSTTTTTYRGDLFLNSSSSTKIYVNIDIPETAELIQVFRRADALHSPENASLTYSTVLDKTRTIYEILKLAMSRSDMTAVFNCVATVNEILDKNETQFKCGNCEKNVDYPVTRYRVELSVKGNTDSTIFVLFDEVAEEMTQMKLVDLTSALENETENGSPIPHQLQRLIGTTHIFQVRMNSYFEGRGRQSFTVSRVVKPKVEKDDKLENKCNASSHSLKIKMPKSTKEEKIKLQSEEEPDDAEQREIGSDLEE
ncbi:hypothetical protein OROGR_017979 [Orobanche gracilis]